MKGTGLLFHFLLLLIIFIFSQANFYALVAFTQGALQKVEILTGHFAQQFETDASVVVPRAMHLVTAPCRNLELPEAPLFDYTDIVAEINGQCETQRAIVCLIYEYHAGDFYMSCQGMTLSPDRTYYFEPAEEDRTMLLEEVNASTVKINIPTD